MLSAHGGSLRYEAIGQIQNWYVILKGEHLGFHLDISLSAPLKKLKRYTQPNIHIFLHTVWYCFHSEHRQVEGVLSAHGGSLRYEAIGQIQNWYVILKGEHLGLSFEYKFVGPSWKLLKIYPTVHSYFSAHCMVLFPLRTSASWRSAKCTRRVLKVWSHWPNSKLMCYSERGAPRLLFEYKFVDLPWKLLKIYPTVHSYFFFSSHSIVLFPLRTPASWRSAKCTRRVLKVWSHWPNSKLMCYSERGAPRLLFGYKFVGLLLKIF